AQGRSLGCVPQPSGLVPTASSQDCAIGTEVHAAKSALFLEGSYHRDRFGKAGDTKDVGVVGAGVGGLAVRQEYHLADEAFQLEWAGEKFARGPIPQPKRAIEAAREDGLAVSAQRGRFHLVRM